MSQDAVWSVGQLRQQWQKDTVLTAALEAAMDSVGFDAAFVSRPVPPTGKPKYIKDSVWGMIEFEHVEVQLIDCPLIQRLRGIRQLGFSYLVYPSAEHTRFVHTLGIAHVVASFASSIDRAATRKLTASSLVLGYKDVASLHPLTRQELVFAALLHDVGHMPYSHASEAALVQNDKLFVAGGQPLETLLTNARLAFGKQISLSEALSVLVVLSSRFAQYYEKLVPAAAADANSLLRIACLIGGVQATPACPNIQDIISAAAVDADKIDYVARDAAACGISVGVDVSRIFMGSALVEAKRKAYDDSVDGEDIKTVFIVNSSGADTLDEIVQARSALYQRVYLHPVTRTAEALLTRSLHVNASDKSHTQAELTDAVRLWAMDDASLAFALAAHPNGEIAALARRLRTRRLPKKACALAGPLATMRTPIRSIFKQLNATAAETIRKDLANTFLERLTRRHIAEIGTMVIEERIRDATRALAEALSAGSRADLVPATPLDLVMLTPIAAMDAARPDALVYQNGELIRTYVMSNVQGQHDAQDIFKAVGFVFCDPDWRPLVLAASRAVILELSEETAPHTVCHEIVNGEARQELSAARSTLLDFEAVTRRANIPRRSAEDVMWAAADAGVFDERPCLYLPTRTDQSDVQKAAAKYRSFEGEFGWTVDRTTVAAFVDQLPPALRTPMLKLLEQGALLGQAAMTTNLLTAINKMRSGDEGVVICPLSSSSGGAAVSMLKDGPAWLSTAASLRQALERPAEPLVVLVDDNAASGVQASAQLYAHAGVAQTERPARLAKEDDLFEGELTAEAFSALCSRPFGIAVAIGLDDAADALSESASTLGITQFRGLTYGARIAEGLTWPEKLKDHLCDIGRELMAHRYERRSFADIADPEIKARCEARAFGYGGRGGILATHSNVPSSTVTALWQPGIVRGRPWTPLFVRRGQLKRLVLS